MMVFEALRTNQPQNTGHETLRRRRQGFGTWDLGSESGRWNAPVAAGFRRPKEQPQR